MANGKEIYLRITKMIKLKEKALEKNQILRVILLEYPKFEIIQIGHLGSEYLAFAGGGSETRASTLLLPAESISLAIDVIDLGETQPAKTKKQIEFCGDISIEK